MIVPGDIVIQMIRIGDLITIYTLYTCIEIKLISHQSW